VCCAGVRCAVQVLVRCAVQVLVRCAAQVNLDTDGVLHAVSVDRSCQYHVDVGETSLVSLVSHDLLTAVPGVELVVATADGSLLCLAAGNASQSPANQMSASELREMATVTACPTQLRSYNDFVFSDTVCISHITVLRCVRK